MHPIGFKHGAPSRRTIWTAIASGLALLGPFSKFVLPYLLALFALTPVEWEQKIGNWAVAIAPSLRNLSLLWTNLTLVGLMGFASIYLLYRFEARGRALQFGAISHLLFEEAFDQAIRSKHYNRVLIFGYTGETLSDYFRYDARYLEGISVMILSRSWIAERRDEVEHNAKIANLEVRPWNKANNIKHQALTPWTYKTPREMRFYDFMHPFIKGVILSGPDGKEAFVSFYRWEGLPTAGGSQFKGADLPMIHLVGTTPGSATIIDNLESQFQYIFGKRCNSLEEELELEKANAPSSSEGPSKGHKSAEG